jgi:hypothetical protein
MSSNAAILQNPSPTFANEAKVVQSLTSSRHHCLQTQQPLKLHLPFQGTDDTEDGYASLGNRSNSFVREGSQYQTSDQVVSTDDFDPTQPSSRPDGRRFPLFNGTQSLSLAKSHQNNSDNNKSSDHASGQNGTGKKILFDV